LSRYSETQLRIDEEALASDRISGAFPAGKQAEFAESLALYFPVGAGRTCKDILIKPHH
jgi:transmembrane sensor